MEHHAEAFAKAGLPFPLVTRLLGVNTLHLIVIGGNDRFLAREIVVSSTEGNVGRAGDIAHGGGFEPGSPPPPPHTPQHNKPKKHNTKKQTHKTSVTPALHTFKSYAITNIC